MDEYVDDDGPTLAEAKAAASAPPEPVPGAEELPTDVRDDASEEEA